MNLRFFTKGGIAMSLVSPPVPYPKSILASANTYIALDIETTGLNPAFDQILELAAVRMEDGEIKERFSQLINPGRHIPPFITELTGIRDEMVEHAPNIHNALPVFLDFLGDSLLLGHNTAFDLRFIRYNSMIVMKHRVMNPYMDTLRISRLLFPDLPDHKLTTLIHAFRVGETVEHRALSDAIQTAWCYEYMKRYAEAQNIPLAEKPKRKKKADGGGPL